MSQSFSDRLTGAYGGRKHGHIPSRDDVQSFVPLNHDPKGHSRHSPDPPSMPEASFTFNTSNGARVNRLSVRSGPRSPYWSMSEKRYSQLSAEEARCPRPVSWNAIVLPTLIIILPMILLIAGLLGLIFGYRVKSDASIFDQVSNSDALGDKSVVLVNYSATRIVFVASWASTLAPLLASFVMDLASFQIALRMFQASSGQDQHNLPTPYQYSLLVGLCLASIGRLRRYLSYSKHQGVNVPPILKRAARTLMFTLFLACVVFASDTALHYMTSTINFDQVTISSELDLDGRALSSECLTLNRTENFGFPCSRNFFVSSTDLNAYVAGQNEIFFLSHSTSNKSEVRLVPSPEDPQQNVALLVPQTRGISPFQDFRANTTGVVTTCSPITDRCQWTDIGESGLLAQFNCTDNFYGVLGKTAVTDSTGMSYANDSDVPPLGFKPSGSLQYSFFTDAGLTIPYDSTGEESAVLPDDQLINPVHFAFAARFAQTAQRAGFNFSTSPLVHTGPTININLILSCQYTTYDVDYSWVNATAHINAMTPSPNGTAAEIFHGYNIVGQTNAFDSNLQDFMLQGALQDSVQSLADNFADSYSTRVMSVIGPFLSDRENVAQQTRTPLLVAKVPKAPLAILAACCLGYVIFGIVVAVMAYQALGQVDVRDLANRFSLAALALHAFKDVNTDRQVVDVDASGHAVFDESRIRSETMRVGAEGGTSMGFTLKSLV